MKIRFSVDLRELLDAEAKMALESRLPEFAAKTLAVSMRDRAESNARSKIGNGGFGQELAEGIRTRSDGAEVVIDPDAAIRLLKETLGNQNCRVVVSLKRAVDKSYGQRKVICLKRIVLHNPETQAYCVLVWDGKELKLVSWNNAGDDYGDSEWTLK